MTFREPGELPPPPGPAEPGRWYDNLPPAPVPLPRPLPAPAAGGASAPVAASAAVSTAPVAPSARRRVAEAAPAPAPGATWEEATSGADADADGAWLDDEQRPAPAPTRKSAAKPPPSPLRSTIEWVGVIAGALLVAVLIRTLFLQTFFIPSESMESTLLKHDRVLVNKLSYKLHDIHRGDVVVFKRPPKETNRQIKDLIKRVIGLPGDTVEGRDGHVLIDGKLLTEPYLDPGRATSDFGPIVIPDGQVFVMGDNRPNSEDSRFFGPIDQKLVVGRAFVRIWPFGRFGWL